MKRLTIDVRQGDYAVAKYREDFAVPPGLFDAGEDGGLVSVTRAPGELSVVCRTDRALGGPSLDAGWRLLGVRGPLEFTLTGIMATLAGVLAAAGVSLFAVSTFDTDHVLVRDVDLARAVAALRDGGHEVHE